MNLSLTWAETCEMEKVIRIERKFEYELLITCRWLRVEVEMQWDINVVSYLSDIQNSMDGSQSALIRNIERGPGLRDAEFCYLSHDTNTCYLVLGLHYS